MKKRAAGRGRKQEGTPVTMSLGVQQLMLPLLLAMDATKERSFGVRAEDGHGRPVGAARQ
jgi:hypothetical protein